MGVAKGCQRLGVLSPLLWDIVVDELLILLNSMLTTTRGVAEYTVIFIMGNYAFTVSGRMHQGQKGNWGQWKVNFEKLH